MHLGHPAKALHYDAEGHGVVLHAASFPGGFVLTAVYTCFSRMSFPFLCQLRNRHLGNCELKLCPYAYFPKRTGTVTLSADLLTRAEIEFMLSPGLL